MRLIWVVLIEKLEATEVKDCFGAKGWNRTSDLILIRDALYRVSYFRL